ncbi:SusD/RagB family nutrient-binding outer membrane lipoprotein [Mucilaginibacter sp. UR6-1]|uniref:SusD/RagB family nutrient-binding outer membrane lipoprotein n=1 Tax=Mucilaginibacter sp. UR6-1 TaxID=1435643 RepID=UPI001E55AB59|nr:SusD/RagB family nutrient-binding outer membrane lipoprotein [Mucilaginibacter sp. UR6-1]MCC8408286.1 SusD/RagB family nutrient-binding outer membrane lipoprotein [Mucilaginibacter sp. UR6-1]
MKKRYIFSFLVAGATFMASCTKNFEEINTQPDKTTEIDPNYFMSQAQIQFSQTGYDQLLFQSMWVQSLASTYNYYTNGDKYVFSSGGTGYYANTWNRAYTALGLVVRMRTLIKDKPEYANLDACATIMQAMIIQRITDLYGDAPYSQAGLADNGVYEPVFDKQEDIYAAILTQLEQATAALDASKAGPTADLLYGGNVAQWKRLGYSLMLKAGMRLTKVDPQTARTWVEKAYAGGTMSSVADNAKVLTDPNGNASSNADALRVTDDFREVRWGRTLLNYMQSTDDPRVSAIAEITVGNGRRANENRDLPGNNADSLQLGMPNGYTITSIVNAPNYPGSTPAADAQDAAAPLGKYSRPRLQVYADRASANFIYTYGESELLLAEAATRGWATGAAATHYANALTADMATLAQYNTTGAATVNASDIATYVTAHPLVAATALQQINMEYYVATSTTFNFNETYANWRRTGIPQLTPVTFSGQFITGQIPRRVPYPGSLINTNGANYQAAVQSQGPDNFATRVWWDAQ